MIYKASDKHTETFKLREEGYLSGITTGFNSLDKIFTLKKGYPLFVAGSPHHGKSEFILDLLVNTSVIHGWKHFIYAGEAGDVQEIISEIAFKYIKKPFLKKLSKENQNEYAMSDSEYMTAMEFVDKHFYFLGTDVDFTIEKFYKYVEDAEQRFDIQFDTTLIDPFNDVDEDLLEHGGREDKWLKKALKYVRVNAKKHNRINILIHHIADIAPVTDKSTGFRYTPVALASEWAGGRTWHRRAFTMLMVYRPAPFLNRPDGSQVLENESWIINQKAKPKGSGKLGQISLVWNWKINRYEELSISGGIIPLKDKEVQKNKKEIIKQGYRDFTEPIKDYENEIPF